MWKKTFKNKEDENREPEYITTWRREYKIKYGGLDYHQKNSGSTPWDVKMAEKEKNDYIESMNELKKIFDAVDKDFNLEEHILNYFEETKNKVPILENPIDYSILKRLSEKVKKAVPKIYNNKDINNSIRNKSPYIITGRKTEFNAESGRTPNPNPDSNEINYYIGFNTLFVYFIKRISVIVYNLFHHIENKDESSDLRKLMDINLQRDPDIYWGFRDFFYHFTLLRNEELNDENIQKLIKEEKDIFGTGSFDIIAIISQPIDMIRESMGLFITGHEWGHLILRHNMINNSNCYKNEIEEFYRKEFQADKSGIELMWNCMQNEFNKKLKWEENIIWPFIGIEIFFNSLSVIDHMHGVLNCNSRTIITKTHPAIRTRIEAMREYIKILWNKNKISQQYVVYLDAVDYIFKKLEKHFVNELSENKHILAYHKIKKQKITKLLNIADKKYKSLQIESYETDQSDINTINELIKIYEDILKEDKNNTTSLFRLGLIYFIKRIDSKSLENFTLLYFVVLEYGDNMNYPLEKEMFFKSHYYIGLIYLRKIEAMLCDNKDNLSKEQQEEKEYYINNAINKLEIASNGYNNNGILFYFLGIVYSNKNNHQKAIENYNKALEYQPDNNQIILALHDSISRMAKKNRN